MRPRFATTLSFLAISSALTLGACNKSADTVTPEPAPTPAVDAAVETPDAAPTTDAWTVALTGAQRSDEHKARDAFRHPKETLQFFGVTPSSTVIELAPGGGWYTEILAPLVAEQGKLIVTSADPAGPEAYYGTRQAKAWQAKVADTSSVFTKVGTVVTPSEVTIGEDGKVSKIVPGPMDLGDENSVDAVLTFRSSHGWYNRDAIEMVYGAAFKVLKPGGVFGVVQHRAPEGSDASKTSKNGYVPEATIVGIATAAGFELAESSAINANPKDTADYAEGVWTLPPSLALKEKDKEKYMAIGESDRMTLKFVKPAK